MQSGIARASVWAENEQKDFLNIAGFLCEEEEKNCKKQNYKIQVSM